MHSLVQIHASRHSDADYIGPRLRHADRSEIAASLGPSITPVAALYAGIDHASDNKKAPVFTIRINEEPMAMFGVYADAGPLVGNIWMVTTSEFPKHLARGDRKRILLTQYLKVLAEAGDYKILRATSYSGNTLHHKWLEVIGFSLAGHVMSRYDYQFHVYTKVI